MISKKEIKYLASLKQKKFRLLNNEFVVEGEKIILDAIKHKQLITKIIYSKKNKNFDIIRKYGNDLKVDLCLCTEKDAERISDTKNSQQIFALIQYNAIADIKTLKTHQEPFIIFDGISDPGNMGTILRTCSWFGCYNIILTKHSVELYNPKAVRSGMGAHFHMKNIFNGSIEDINNFLIKNKYEIYVADLKGKNIETLKSTNNNWSLILGNESKGISKEFKKNAKQIHIPGKGKMESLNVAEAASIVIHYLSKK